MGMIMENRILTLGFIFIMLVSCKNECNEKNADFSTIQFRGFNKIKIDNISFKDLNTFIDYDYKKPKFDSIDKELNELNVKEFSSISLEKGFLVTINDTLKYKISNIKMEEIYLEKKTMWNTKLYGCSLSSYKQNDSLIESHGEIFINK